MTHLNKSVNQTQRLDFLDLRRVLTRQEDSHKGNFGRVLVLGGDQGMAGAAILAAKAALYGGAGWIVAGLLDKASVHVLADWPEIMVRYAQPDLISLQEPTVTVIGPGLGQSQEAIDLLQGVLKGAKPVVMDADALNIMASNDGLLKTLTDSKNRFVLTPHPGEMARLLKCTIDEVQGNRVLALQQLIELTQAVVVLKGHHTLVGSPGSQVFECHEGNPGMATGGSGDVLAGLIGSIVSQAINKLSLLEATGLAVQIHSLAADHLVARGVGPIGLTPSELIVEIRHLINIKNRQD